MACTLITSIGTGMYKEGYRKTCYQFADGDKVETAWFLQALLNKKYREFEKVILIGTKTSNWDSLIDLDDSDAEELWEKVSVLNQNKQGITEELISPLEEQLKKQYSIPFKIIVHTDLIDTDTCSEVFGAYNKIIPEISPKSDVLFDVTHGFRTMPILMYQNLQFLFSNNISRKIEIVYGEYIKDREISFVRDLTNFWTLGQIKDAKDLFEKKLDGFKLAELIKGYWTKGSKAIKSLSEIVQTNFSLQIFEVARQIKNAIAAYPKNAPVWLSNIKAILESLVAIIDENHKARSLYNYSKFLYEHNLNVQAVITLQVAVEAAVVSAYHDENKLGDYEWWQDQGKPFLKEQKKKSRKDLRIPLTNLESFRNQIAHGGGKNREGNFPMASNIPGIYQSGIRGVENLLEELQL